METYLIMITAFIIALIFSNTIVLIHEEDGSVSSFFSKQLTDARWFVSTLIVVTATAIALRDMPLNIYIIGILIAIVTVFDLKYLLAPNFMNLFILIGGLMYHLITYKHLTSLSDNIMTCMFIFLVWVMVNYLFKGGIGGGDFKLLMALSFTYSADQIFLTVLIASLTVTAISPIFLIQKKKLDEVVLPLVPFILFGYIITARYGDAFIEWYTRGGY